ncbi:MAG: hypothetical protein OXR62_03585 [Ahrensia sp.]|nr:hypothetical protein [Ahrensia sp.]
MIIRATLALVIIWLLISLVRAEPVGIAFVEAPEQGGGVCVGKSPDDAFECAKRQCTASGTEEKDCLPIQWCYPSGWSTDTFLLHNEGVHWHEVSCGWPNREAAMAAAAIRCDRTHRDFIVDCTIVEIYDPQGRKTLK